MPSMSVTTGAMDVSPKKSVVKVNAVTVRILNKEPRELGLSKVLVLILRLFNIFQS